MMKVSEYSKYDALGSGDLVSRAEVSPEELADAALRADGTLWGAANSGVVGYERKQTGHRF